MESRQSEKKYKEGQYSSLIAITITNTLTSSITAKKTTSYQEYSIFTNSIKMSFGEGTYYISTALGNHKAMDLEASEPTGRIIE